MDWHCALAPSTPVQNVAQCTSPGVVLSAGISGVGTVIVAFEEPRLLATTAPAQFRLFLTVAAVVACLANGALGAMARTGPCMSCASESCLSVDKSRAIVAPVTAMKLAITVAGFMMNYFDALPTSRNVRASGLRCLV